MRMKDGLPSGFERPTSLPESDSKKKNWQSKNRTWWEKHPMRYDWKDEIQTDEFSKEFYLEIDKRFFLNVKKYMPPQEIPFDPLINFDGLKNQDVLEIGVGNGSHAQLLAKHAKSYTGIDLTDYSVRSTSKRMACFRLNAKIIRMDAEEMDFNDDMFDFIWSWGVIHHSSNTEKILKEMQRVLKPGGTAITMVYHRSIWNYYIMHGLFRGIIQGDLFKTRSLHKTVQRYTDGAIARYYTSTEWRSLVSKYFDVKKINVYGSKAELMPLPGGHIKDSILGFIPDNISRFVTNQLRFGTFLVSILEKNDDGKKPV